MQQAGQGVQVITHWSAGFRHDWLRGTTVCAPPARTYNLEGVPVSQIGFSLAIRSAMLPATFMYYPLMRPAIAAIAGLMAPGFERLAGRPTQVHASRMGREFIVQTALDFARRRDIPFVLTPNHHPRWKGYLYRAYDRIYRQADAVVVLTTAERDILVHDKGVPEEKVHVTGIGPVLADNYSVPEFRARLGTSDPFVLYLGQQYKYKGVGALVDAAAHVWKTHPSMRFVFAGPHTEYSERLFRDIHDPRIINLGVVDLRTKTAALAACEFMCLPSQQESFGGVFVEAWSMRKAVIGGRTGPLSCVVDDGQDGLLLGQDPGELSSAIVSLLDNPRLAGSMGNAGYEKVQQRYTWRQIAAKTLGVYRGLD
jgi:glycosyltransferase involved in cell wall biosynthesis